MREKEISERKTKSFQHFFKHFAKINSNYSKQKRKHISFFKIIDS